MEQFEIKSYGKRIVGTSWIPKESKATVFIIHGYGEHIGRYQSVASQFNLAGLAVVGVDLAGHGRSEGKRGDIRSFDEYLNNIQELVNYMSPRQGPKYAYGHSMGGSIAANYLISHPGFFNATIITSPWFRLAIKAPAIQLAAARFLKTFGISITQRAPLDPMTLSRDKSVGEAYSHDPLVHNKITSRSFFELMSAGERALADADQIKLPLLVAHGTDDGITSFEASRTFAEKSGAEFKAWPGMFHETHNEIGKEEVVQYYLHWILQQL